jgi:Protein of unknown function (DUF4233)
VPRTADREAEAAVRRLCATILVLETIVIWLAIPVAIVIGHTSPARALGAGAAAAAAAVLLAGLVGRFGRWPYVAGTVLQAVVIAFGTVVPVMYFLGAVFAALWLTGMWLGYRVEHRRPS